MSSSGLFTTGVKVVEKYHRSNLTVMQATIYTRDAFLRSAAAGVYELNARSVLLSLGYQIQLGQSKAVFLTRHRNRIAFGVEPHGPDDRSSGGQAERTRR